MKQFSLEEYLNNPNRKIVTRDGRNVRIICTDKKSTDFPIVALIECEDKEETCYYTKKGYWNSCEIVSKIDLFFAPEKHEGWVNVYHNREHQWCGDINRTEAEAKEFKDSKFYITTIKIEWEE